MTRVNIPFNILFLQLHLTYLTVSNFLAKTWNRANWLCAGRHSMAGTQCVDYAERSHI